MIEVIDRDERSATTYTEQRAFDVFGPDLLAEMLSHEHPTMRATRVNGRGNPTPMLRTVCSWCGRLLEERPAPDGVERETHSICIDCRLEMLDKRNEEKQKADALEAHWLGAW